MIREVARIDGDWLVVLTLLVLFATSPRIKTVEENFFPIDLVVPFVFLGCRFGFWALLLLVFLFLHLDHLEEGIVQQFLLEMLLEVQERHVEQVHRLIQAWIDLELLLELRALLEASFHCTSPPPSPFSRSKSSSRFEEFPLPSAGA